MPLDDRIMKMVLAAKGKYSEETHENEAADDAFEDGLPAPDELELPWEAEGEPHCSRYSEDGHYLGGASWRGHFSDSRDEADEIAARIDEYFETRTGIFDVRRGRVIDGILDRTSHHLQKLGVEVDWEFHLGDAREVAALLHQKAWACEMLADLNDARNAAKPRIRVPARMSYGNVIPFRRK